MIAAVDKHSAASRAWCFALLLVAGTLAVYLPVWHAGLIWDDGTFIVHNPLIPRSDGVYQFWFSTKPVSYYPVTSTLLWLEWRLWGDHPLGYHVLNVLLHGLDAVLLWRALKSLNISGAWLAAALFAVHPVNVESVAWISERKNTLALFFGLLSLLAYLKFDPALRPTPSAPGSAPRVRGVPASSIGDPRRWYWISWAAFALALLSKTAVAPAPLLILGFAWWQRGRVQRRDVARSAPFVFLAIVVGYIAHWFEAHRAIGGDLLPVESFWTRLAGAGFAAWFYLYKAILPFDLRPIYPRWEIDPSEWYWWLPLLGVGAGAYACWKFRLSLGKAPIATLGYFLLMLSPVLGFLDINFMRYSWVADRWQYFAIIGPLALGAAALFPAHRSSDQRRLWIAGATVCALGILSYRQCAIYSDPRTFWQAALAGNPDSTVAHNNLGTVLLEAGQLDEAKAHFERVLELNPDHGMAHYNLGGVLRQQGRGDEALAEFQRAVDSAPGHVEAQLNLAQLQAARGRADEAIGHFESALALKPDDAQAHNALGLLLLQQGRLAPALAHLERAVELEPTWAEAQSNDARALSQNGQLDAAIAHLERAVELQPAQPEAFNNLANLLRQQGRLGEAANRYRTAIELRPDYALAHYNFGELLRQIAKPADAANEFQTALTLRPNFAPARRALEQLTRDAPTAMPASTP